MRAAPPRQLMALAILAGLLGIGCRSTSEPASQPSLRADGGHGGGSADRTDDAPRGIVACAPRTADSASAFIGPEGGTLRVGGNSLEVPPRALTSTVRISATVPAGDFAGIHFEPEGLRFNRPANLSLDATGCDLPAMPAIDYVNDDGRIVERIPAGVLEHRKVGAPIKHFSIYAIGV
jgi:hypothetical protein